MNIYYTCNSKFYDYCYNVHYSRSIYLTFFYILLFFRNVKNEYFQLFIKEKNTYSNIDLTLILRF